MILLNLFLGTLVTAGGFWIIWGSGSPAMVLGWALVVGMFLWSQAWSITAVWAWSTLLLGLESFAWPVTLMVQLRSTSATPSEDEMGTILSAVVLGLFSSVFWISFAYGLFKRAQKLAGNVSDEEVPVEATARMTKPKKSRSS